MACFEREGGETKTVNPKVETDITPKNMFVFFHSIKKATLGTVFRLLIISVVSETEKYSLFFFGFCSCMRRMKKCQTLLVYTS